MIQVTPPKDQTQEALRLDYEQTTEIFRMLSDVRFKLLTFIPTLTGAAVSLLTGKNVQIGTVIAVGIIGFSATFGIIIYELRNSLFYDLSISRSARLESMLKLPRFTKFRQNASDKPGGFFTERPPLDEKPEKDPLCQEFFHIKVKHDIGLAWVYGASLGGWTFIIINAVLGIIVDTLKPVGVLPTKPPQILPWYSFILSYYFVVSLIGGVVIAWMVICQFNRLDDQRYVWQFGRDQVEGHITMENQYASP